MNNKKNLVRHIIGYTIGIIIFWFLIPFLIIKLSVYFDSINRFELINGNKLNLILAVPFFIIGVFFTIWSNISLFLIGEGGPTVAFNLAISPRTKKLVYKGPYRYSRNPMVFGTYLAYLSLILYLNSFFCFLILIGSFILIIIYLKLTEERRLTKEFGDEYLEYKERVSMIIPFPQSKIPP